MYSSNMTDRMAHMKNKKVLPTIGFFNDSFRETIKGKTFNPKDIGYVSGNYEKIDVVKEMILGSALNGYIFKYTSQSINYVECHDNLTFFDKYLYITDDVETIKKQQKLATSLVLLSQGVPFIHSGQEFFRTKQKDENSFKSGDKINLIDWSLTDENAESIEYFKNLVQIRKDHPCFKLKSTSEIEQNVELLVLNSNSIMVHYNNECNLLVIFKPSSVLETVIIPDEYKIVLASTEEFEVKPDSEYELKDIGTYIFKKDVN
jgi:pullulanase